MAMVIPAAPPPPPPLLAADPASRPGVLACIGQWHSRGKIVSIAQRGEHLVLEMGADSPSLRVVPANASGEEVWPMVWHAIRSEALDPPDPKDLLYIIELPTPVAHRLLVRRPVGDAVVEFVRAGMSAPLNGTGVAPVAAMEAHKSRSRTRSSGSRSRSRSTSRRRGDDKAAGEWACSQCSKRNAAQDRTCRSCNAPRPVVDGVVALAAGAPAAPAATPKILNIGPVGEGRDAMVSQIKRGQRESVTFKERWWEHCDRYGNGYYDPNRHETRFLEDFLDNEVRGGRAKRRSKSRSSSSGGAGSRSRSRSRSRRKQRRRRHRRKKRRRSRRRDRKGRRRRKRSRSSRSSSRSSSDDGLEKDLQNAVAAAEQAEKRLAEAKREVAAGGTPEALLLERERQQAEILRATQEARDTGERDLAARLKEIEEKLLDEKAPRLREAEQRLDKAIEQRLKEAEKRLRKEADARIEEAKRTAEENAKEELAAAERRAHAEVASKVEEAEAKLSAAKARLATLKATDKGSGSDSSEDEESRKDGGDGSASASGDDSSSGSGSG